MTDLSYLDTDTSKVSIPREPPEGNYLAQPVDFNRQDGEEGKVKYTIRFKLLDALDGQDLTGVNLNRAFFSKPITVSEKNLGYVLRDMKKFGVPLENIPMRDIFETVVKAEPTVKVVVAYDKWVKENKDEEKAVILRWMAAS